MDSEQFSLKLIPILVLFMLFPSLHPTVGTKHKDKTRVHETGSDLIGDSSKLMRLPCSAMCTAYQERDVTYSANDPIINHTFPYI